MVALVIALPFNVPPTKDGSGCGDAGLTATPTNQRARECSGGPPKCPRHHRRIDSTLHSSFTHFNTMASIFQAFPQLRTAAPRLSRRLFVCRPCLNAPARSAFAASRSPLPRPNISQSVRWKSTQPLRSSATIIAPHVEGAILADTAKSQARASSFPKTSSNTVAYWLLGSAASVFGIVVFGGLTRLTESG